ncbi:MAG: Cof-type HAD-IIB family hydrolase [Clostridiales bacterium]|nr:Cof-type HAD-IIB family hydrolase [Clostridiales bacterium]
MGRKIVFFDIDGTLYNHDIGVPRSAVKAIEKLLENNHIPVISTGRSRAIIPRQLIDIGFKGIIAAAGADVSFEDKEIVQIVDNKETAREIIGLLNEGKIDFVLEGPNYVYYDANKDLNIDPHIRSVVETIGIDKFKSFDEDEVVYNKISAAVNKNSVIHDDVRKRYDIIVHSGIPVVEMVPKGTNKAVGIKKMLEFLDVDKKDTYAFGDSNNDMEMLDYVEYGIAMGNAYPDVLKKARYKTKSIYEDGIYYGLKDFGLI